MLAKRLERWRRVCMPSSFTARPRSGLSLGTGSLGSFLRSLALNTAVLGLRISKSQMGRWPSSLRSSERLLLIFTGTC